VAGRVTTTAAVACMTLAAVIMAVRPAALPAQGAPAGAVRAGAPPTTDLPGLAGTWRGTLVNLPLRPRAPQVDVTVELGAYPTADSSCVPWKTTYRERDTVRAVKDYRLCRGVGPGDMYVDEGGGVRLSAQLLGDLLVSGFKVGNALLVTQLRVRGDSLIEEILSFPDRPATEGLVTLTATSVQRLSLVRVRTPGR